MNEEIVPIMYVEFVPVIYVEIVMLGRDCSNSNGGVVTTMSGISLIKL